MILSWAGGGGSPPVPLWSDDDDEEEEEGILLFVAIKYKKKTSNDEVLSEEEEEDVNNNSDRLTDSGIGEEHEKITSEEKKVLGSNKDDEINPNMSERKLKEDEDNEQHPAKEGDVKLINDKLGDTGGSENENIESSKEDLENLETIESSKGEDDSKNLKNENAEDDCKEDKLDGGQSEEVGGSDSPVMTNLAEVVNLAKMTNLAEKDTNVKAPSFGQEKKDREEENEELGLKDKIERDGADKCDIKVVNDCKTEGDEGCSKRVTWKSGAGLEERLGGEKRKAGVRKSREVDRGRAGGRGRGGVRGLGKVDKDKLDKDKDKLDKDNVISERPSGVEIGRAWERSLRLRTSGRGDRALRSQDRAGRAGRSSSSLRGKTHVGQGGGGGGDGEERVEGDWEADGGGGPGWRSQRRLRSKPHRPSSGR